MLLASAEIEASFFWSAGSGRDLLTIADGGTGPQRSVSQTGRRLGGGGGGGASCGLVNATCSYIDYAILTVCVWVSWNATNLNSKQTKTYEVRCADV